MGKTDPITLSKTHFLYIFLVLFIVLPTILLLSFSNIVPALWCHHFELPEYEKQLGFKMGEIPSPEGDATSIAWGITWVDPDGPWGQAGVRAGDVPHTHHGGEFCFDMRWVARGRPMQVEVINVLDDGPPTWRRLTVRKGSP
jgi:hypothetical protein